MKALLTTAALFAAALFILDVPAALAQTTFDAGGDGSSWEDPKNWTAGVPDEDDLVTIGKSYTVELDQGNGVADSLSIAGELNITGYSLTVDGSTSSSHTITRSVYLRDGSSSLVFTGRNHSISGSGGAIIGEHNTAMIDDDGSSRQLTIASGFTIQGALTIDMSLVNNGTVLADDGTTEGSRDRLLLDLGTYTGSGLFEVTRALGGNPVYLEFDATGVTATGLATGFTVSPNGTLDCETTVTTTKAASLSFTGGKIIADAGVTVTFN